MQKWDKDGKAEPLILAHGEEDRVVPWFNNESIFYSNDRRQSGWVHKDSSPEPYTKGEGALEMVGEYLSPDFGYLKSYDGTQSARIVWKPGKIEMHILTTIISWSKLTMLWTFWRGIIRV
jgi:hypothetical protein